MTRTPGLFALTRRRLASPRSAAVVVVALTVLAAFVISAAPRALVGIVRAEVAHQIAGIPATSRDLTAELSGAPAFGPAEEQDLVEGWDEGATAVFGLVAQSLADHRADIPSTLDRLVEEASFAAYARGFGVVGDDLPADAPFSVVQLLSEPTMRTDLVLVDGEWPAEWDGEGPVEIILSDAAARTMAWPIGEVRSSSPDAPATSIDDWRDGSATVVLAGTVAAADPDADRWRHLPTALTATVFDDGNRRPTATSAAWVAPSSWAQVAPTLQTFLTAWYPVDAAAALDEEPRDLLAALRAATSESVPFDDTGVLRARFESEIVDVLTAALGRADAASAILAVAAVGPLAVSVALVVLAGALMIRRRRTDLALMSARGAPTARLRRLLVVEGLLLGVPAAVLAAAAGMLATRDDAGPLPTAIAVLVGTVPALALSLALRASTLTRERADLDAPSRGRARGIVEIVVVVLAALAVTQLVLRGVSPSGGGIDPLVVVAPLLATVALALVAVRLHPLPIRAALGVARRGRGVVGLVGAARDLRDPAAGSTAVLAMLVAVAIAVFSSVVLATVDRGAVVAAERGVGADIQLSGPYVDAETIERMRAIDGVRDAVGVLRGDYFGVSGDAGTTSALVLVTDVDRLAGIQRGMVGAIAAGRIAPESDPVQIILSRALAEDVGGGAATIADAPAEVVGTVERMLGMSVSTQFAVMDVADYRDATGSGFFPRNVFVSVEPGADAAAVADAAGALIGSAHSVELLSASTAEIQASPAVTALRVVLLSALGLAVALSVVAVLLVAGVSQDARSRVLALLRSMGLDRRRGRGIVAWEFAPLGLTALVGGVILGAVLPLLVVLSIDLRPFTGGGAQPALFFDPILSGALIAVVILALAVAVVVGVAGARTTSMATVLRTEED